ncbi:hypothetical protein [Methylotenera sp.]|uniref:hypothetical protein n=1 Tax=Methylotenera sp. TaxID=2051956 RepID=UPI0024875089|nr:hypothetical protein [Methylotenera sp.]MDI1362517.1 hypothetical protein [Methylotenera sp.]
MAAKDNQVPSDAEKAAALEAETATATQEKLDAETAAALDAETAAATQAKLDAESAAALDAEKAAALDAEAAAAVQAPSNLKAVTATVMDLRDPFKGAAVEEDNWLRVGEAKDVEITPWLEAQIKARYAVVS